MSNIMPEGDALRKAVKWISDSRKENPDANIVELINEACARFDLSPKDSDFLFNLYRDKSRDSDDS